MDILNWIYLVKNKFTRTTVENPATDLLVIGADVSYAKRGDKYQNYVMTVEDFLASAARPYKVYTALLTQNGDSNNLPIVNEPLTIGVTYIILDNGDGGGCDFTNVGAPNNNFNTYFVATGTTPNSWGENVYLEYNTGAPVVTVLENTIGNVWFTYNDVGNYLANSDGLFTINKTITQMIPERYIEEPAAIYGYQSFPGNPNYVVVGSYFNDEVENGLGNYAPNAIEIRVYN
jgi:hypothetical protein